MRRYNNLQNLEGRRIKAVPRIILRLGWGAAAFLLVAFAVVVLWLRYFALPNVDRYRDDIVASIEKASGMSVSARAIRGGWEGLRPRLTLEGFAIADRRGKAAFALERADVTLSWWTLFAGHVRFYDVDFYRPELHVRRGKDGLVYIADKPLNEAGPDEGAFTEWLLSQPQLGIHEAVLTWQDEMTGAPEVRLTGVEIEVRRRRGRHHAALTAIPPSQLGGRLDMRADVRLSRHDTHWKAAGEVYVDGRNADLGRLRAHLPVPETLRRGFGNLRVWVQFNDTGLREVVADLDMRDARVELAADTLPLELASIAGRASYRVRPDGFTFATEGLRFRLATGMEARPGNFSVTRTADAKKPARVEVRADGIDLKIAATLLDYFPVPRDVKGQVLRFAPRGRIADAAIAWTGEPGPTLVAYSVKGRFEDLALNPVEAFPGVTGLSGHIEGTEAGGSVELDSKNATMTLEKIFRAPLAFDTLVARASWKHKGPTLEVTLPEARFANADAEGKFSGTWHSLPDAKVHSPGFLDLKGTLARAAASRAPSYLPNRLEATRDWLERAILAGTGSRVAFELKGDLYKFPFGDGSGRVLVEGDIHDGRLKYHPDWPSVDAIEGTFRFENQRMEIHAERASIFASRASAVSALIEDLGAKPPVLAIQGDVDTTGADGVRFLRESPLVNGPGAFTRAVSIEGPGKLKLAFQFPLWGPDPVRVHGEYTFSGAAASVARNLTMRDVRGHLAFTEKGVRAPEITGSVFGKPAILAMSTQTDGQVVTVIDGKIDAPGIAAYVPEPIAARLSGMADWKARIVSGKQGSEVHVASDLKGVASTLPEPFAKPVDQVRPLAITITRLGSDNEVTTATLGDGINGRFARVSPGSDRWSAVLKFGGAIANEPMREGLWLQGELASVDVDAWQGVFPSREAPPARSEAAGLELRGVDLTLGHVRYWGREFEQARARLARTGSEWSGKVESPLVAGDIRWNGEGKGRVFAKLDRLAITEPAPDAAEAPQGAQRDLPALDITAEKFDFRGKWLGKLELKAEPAGEEWRIDKLDITNGHAQFHSTGMWRRTGTGPLTTLRVKLESENLNALMAQFGYGDYIKRGTGHLEGTLVWPGYPYDFALANLAGNFSIEARRGQFAKIEPGAGKLLGLLSLQSLPQRALFDFRDVFSAGFAFDRINGDVKVARGILLTDAFEISGPSAFVSLAGEASLPQETQNLTMHIVPEVSEGLALAATLIGTPVLGLSTLLVSKLLRNPLGKAVAYEYRVTGSWDNPEVARISAPPPRAAAAPDAAPANR